MTSRVPTDPSKCRSCRADILWAEWEFTGKKMPVDECPDMRDPAKGGGNLVLKLRGGPNGKLIVERYEAQKHGPKRNRYTSHFAGCPAADQHRRER